MSLHNRTDVGKWLDLPDTWEKVAEAIGEHDYSYDFDDRSHRLDAVQIILIAAADIYDAEARPPEART